MNRIMDKVIYLLGLIVYIVFLVWLTYVDYYLFHLIVEISTFMIGFTLVIFVSISNKNLDLNFAKPIALGLFLSSVILIIHMLLYEDFGILSQYTINESLQFWILGNLILAMSFLYSVISKVRPCNFKVMAISIILFAIVNSILIFSHFYPDFYSADSGLRTIKVVLEALIIVIYMGTFLIVYKTRKEYNKNFFIDFLLVLALLILAELLFTQYRIVSDLVNSIAHIVKLSGVFVLMIALVKEFIVTPMDDQLIDLSCEVKSMKKSYLQAEKNADIFKALYDDAPLGYQSLDSTGNFVNVNDTYAKMLGYTKREMLGRNFGEFMTFDSSIKLKDSFQSFIERGTVDVIFEMKHKNGNTVPVRFLGKIAYKSDGGFKQTHCILMDISNEVEYQKGIIENKQKLEDIIEVTSEGLFTLDANGNCISVNAKALNLLGYSNSNELVGKKIHELIHHHGSSGTEMKSKDCLLSYSSGGQIENETDVEDVFWTKDNKKIEVIINSMPLIFLNKVQGVTISFRDKQISKNIVNSLINLSYHDSLTGIFNRRYYEEEIKNLDTARNYPISIIVSDINGLKLINDAFGNNFGDKFILHAVDVFIRNAKQNDFIARIGGDEFIIVMPKTSKKEAEQRVEKMIKASKRYNVKSVQLSISFGIATKTELSESYSDMYKSAEDQMYRMKLHDVPSMRSNTIDTIIKTLYEKDIYSENHSRSVSKLSEIIASKCGVSLQDISEVRMAGLLHDIGKIIIPTSIIEKKGKLSDAEYQEIKKHPEIGYRILYSSVGLRHLADVVLTHHEWWNGKGYPQQLKEEEIPFLARVICVADAFDAMTSERTYRKTMSKTQALNEIKRCSGTQFDPKIVDVFVTHFDQIIKSI